MSAATLPEEVDDRDRRAASEAMICVPHGPGLIRVYSGETSVYTVDVIRGRCECDDAVYRDVQCKHQRRAKMSIGERAIPDGVDVDSTLLLMRGESI